MSTVESGALPTHSPETLQEEMFADTNGISPTIQ